MNEGLVKHKRSKDSYKIMLKKSSNIDNLRKILDFLQTEKDNITNIFTDAANVKEELSELKTKMGDCEIQTNIVKRKTELG